MKTMEGRITKQWCAVCPPDTHTKYGSPSRAYDVVTIGHGGWMGFHSCHPSGHTSGYGVGFRDSIDAHTIIVDQTTMEWDDLARLSIRGPMLGIALPDGVIDCLGQPARAIEVGEHPGAFDYVALDLYLAARVALGAAVCTGDQYIKC